MKVSRRQLFGSLVELVAEHAVGAVERTTGAFREAHAAAAAGEPAERTRVLLPPGALEPPRFHEACTRCGDCLDACEPGAILVAGPEAGPHGGYPIMTPEEIPCQLCEGFPCIAACRDGALLPLAGRRDVDIGVARIDPSACYQHQGQPCDYCVVRCPLTAEAIRFDSQGKPEVLEDGCTGCGQCAWLCPAGAIGVK